MMKIMIILLISMLHLFFTGCGIVDDSAVWETWQEAYKELLLEYADKLDNVSENSLGQFLLYDMNSDDVPKLMIFEQVIYENGYFVSNLNIVSAYSFLNGELVVIDTTEFPEVVRIGIVRTIDSSPGIVAVTHDGGGSSLTFKWVTLDNSELSIYFAGTSTFNAFPDYDHMVKEIEGQEVTEEEFWSIFPEWSKWEHLTKPLAEINIRNLFSNMFLIKL